MKRIVFISLVSIFILACNKELTTPEALKVEKIPTIVKSDDYWANVRAWKKTKHPISFGWFGDWSGTNPSRATRLSALPDSIDVISIWGGGDGSDTSEDLRYFKEVMGGRVMRTLITNTLSVGIPSDSKYYIPEDQYPTDRVEAFKIYGDALGRYLTDEEWDGFDIDYEPGYATQFKDGWPRGQELIAFIEALSKYFGPKSGTGKLLCIDGDINAVPAEYIEFFDYGISQAYNTNGPASLQARFNSGRFSPEQFIVTENIGDYWRAAGVEYRDPNYGTLPSLLGMAYWNPTQGQKGGMGGFIIQRLYGNNYYEPLRRAIQIMNPADTGGNPQASK